MLWVNVIILAGLMGAGSVDDITCSGKLEIPYESNWTGTHWEDRPARYFLLMPTGSLDENGFFIPDTDEPGEWWVEVPYPTWIKAQIVDPDCPMGGE